MKKLLLAALIVLLASNVKAGYRDLNSITWWKTATFDDVVKQAKEYPDNINKVDYLGYTALHYASRYGDFSSFKLILKATKDVSLVTNLKNGWSTIMQAAASNRDGKQKVEALIKAGADVMAQDEYGFSALHILMVYNKNVSSEIIQILFNAGADVMARTRDGDTPLHHASWPKEAEVLIKNGAKVTARNESGLTPLHVAALSAATKQGLVEVLLEAGSDPNAKDKFGSDPWYYVEFYGHLKGTKSYWALNDARFNN